MRVQFVSIFLTLSWFSSFRVQSTSGEEHNLQEEKNRRILHQPLFPASSAAPPPPSPSPPPSPDLHQDLPFFHELPTGPTLEQGQRPPPAPTSSAEVANPVATQPSKLTKKVAIAISSGILTLGILSAMAFYWYKHRVKHPDESQKLVGGNSQRINEESSIPPSTFLYIGTVETSNRNNLVNETNGSLYRKLKSGKRPDRYRPSPELQPLPPLTKPMPTPNVNSPPRMSSSDDESRGINFYTPQGSSMSNESPSSRHSHWSNNTNKGNQVRPDNHVVSSVPYSKRTSPKSRLSASPDTWPVIIPSIKQLLPSPPPPPSPPPTTSSLRPLQPSKTVSYISEGAKFPAPPPPLNIEQPRSISIDEKQKSKIPIPPPPPPQPLIPRKHCAVETRSSLSIPKQLMRPQSKNPIPISTPEAGVTRPVEEVYQGVSPSKRFDGEDKDGSKPKLKPLHWDKVQAISDRATVWDQLKSSSFHLNEDAMESLFGCNSANSVPKEANRKSGLPLSDQENRVLDPKKSQNIAILLRALNVAIEEVSEALLNGNPEGLGPELLETLAKMAPTKEEEIKLKDYKGESSKLGSAERFLKAILDIPFAFKRVEAMLYRANFHAEVKYLRKSFQTLQDASEELKNSRLFLKLLEAVLRTGNRMNDGTNLGYATAFKLDTLLKLVDIKGTDGKTTLLHFVVQEIIRSEGAGSDSTCEILPNKTNFEFKEEDFKKQGLQVVAGLSKELGNVKKAAGMDSVVLSSYVSKLEMGLEKVRLILQYENQSTQGKFFNSMKVFLDEAVDEISKVKADERKTLSLVKEATEYFHGDSAKEEAHRFRVFIIVRDFLSVLDNVCTDVGRMQDRTTMGTGKIIQNTSNCIIAHT